MATYLNIIGPWAMVLDLQELGSFTRKIQNPETQTIPYQLGLPLCIDFHGSLYQFLTWMEATHKQFVTRSMGKGPRWKSPHRLSQSF